MRARWILAAVVALLALSGGTAAAQGRGRGRDKGLPPGQAKKAERQEARFDDHDRQIARNWYVHERRGGEDRGEDREDEDRGDRGGRSARELPPGLRDRDRLPPGIERQLRAGWVVDPDDRRLLYPAPVVLVRGFAPPPPGFRYFAFGGHIVLVDPGYRVLDVIHLEIDLGP